MEEAQYYSRFIFMNIKSETFCFIKKKLILAKLLMKNACECKMIKGVKYFLNITQE